MPAFTTERTYSGIWAVEILWNGEGTPTTYSTHISLDEANRVARRYFATFQTPAHGGSGDTEDMEVYDVLGEPYNGFACVNQRSASVCVMVREQIPFVMRVKDLKNALQLKGVFAPKGSRSELMKQLKDLAQNERDLAEMQWREQREFGGGAANIENEGNISEEEESVEEKCNLDEKLYVEEKVNIEEKANIVYEEIVARKNDRVVAKMNKLDVSVRSEKEECSASSSYSSGAPLSQRTEGEEVRSKRQILAEVAHAEPAPEQLQQQTSSSSAKSLCVIS